LNCRVTLSSRATFSNAQIGIRGKRFGAEVKALGLDGFRNGWVVVCLCGDQRNIHFRGNIADALSNQFDRAAIDIPIGMNHDGLRDCDLFAREKLRPYTSRVFTGARRWLWEEFDDPDNANREALNRNQKRVSRQLWHLGPKIMEVDAFVREHPFLDIIETHPELVVQRLNNGSALPSKKSEEGISERQNLLVLDGFSDINEWLLDTRIGTGAKRDDVLDACAAAVAARDHVSCVPEGLPLLDAHGLPMQIWF
jgi:predicted RNase H-like nuclease